uniref:Bm1298, isoform a n=1 Tax=Brugia malayi TaxID=6279 RepID=A0A0J9XTC8_BRUMA|nr:Bm1298, isoform a [Brugia malayi]
MQNHSLGILVFPTRRSHIILDNPSLLHYGSYNRNICHPHNANEIVKEILIESDNISLNSDNKTQQNSEKITSISNDLLDDLKYSSAREYDNLRNAYKNKDKRREYEKKSNNNKTTISISDQLIQELKQLPNGMMSLKDYKLKQKNLINEQQKLLEIDIEMMKKECTPDKYINQVPEFINGTTKPLPIWKRQMLARKIANEDMQKKEEEFRRKFHEWKAQFYPIGYKPKC